MPDAATSRGSAAAKRSPAGPVRQHPARGKTSGPQLNTPPLKTKAEKRAEAKAAKARARAAQKRRQVLTVGGAAVAVLALVVGLVVWIAHSSPSSPSAADLSAADTATSAPSTPESTESTAPSVPFPPVPAGADPALKKKPKVTTGTGTVTKLTTTTLVKGKGAAVESGQTINVNYVGVTYADGKEFDSSWSRSTAFSFQIGAGKVIPGWDKGLIGVPVGSRVRLDIPAAQAYGDKPTGGQPAGTLRFVVDVLSAS